MIVNKMSKCILVSLTPDWLNNIVNLTDVPILKRISRLNYTDHIDFIKLEDVDAPIMKSFDIAKRPFITLRVINRETNNVSVHAIYQRYPTRGGDDFNDVLWCYGTCYEKILNRDISDTEKDFLARLFKHEPCGQNQPSGETIRITSDNKSIIELI